MTDPSVPTRAMDDDPEDARAVPPRDQDGRSGATGTETPGDLDAPDIVGPTGEEMPVQDHDDVDGDRAATHDRTRE